MIKPVDKYICYWIKMCATTVILFSHFNCNSNDFKQQKSFKVFCVKSDKLKVLVDVKLL